MANGAAEAGAAATGAAARSVEADLALLLGIDTGWSIAFALGVVVILSFARRQLNQPLEGEAAQRRRARLLQMFAPDQLRSPAVFAQGFVFYAGSLLVAYTLLSLGGASLLRLMGVTEAGAGLASGALDGASAPLFFALMIVGLMPGSPVLGRIERRMRELAHRMVGIPEHFHEFTDLLLAVRIDPDAMGDLRIGGQEAQELRAVLAALRAALGPGPAADRLEQGVLKLYAFRAWQSAAPEWPSWAVRNEFRRLETEIVPVAEAVAQDLLDLSARDAGPAPADAADAAQALRVAESRWTALAGRVHESVEDICALFALYAERAESKPRRDNPVSDLLRDLITHAEAQRAETSPQVDIFVKALLTMAAVMFVIGFVGEATDINPMNMSAQAAGAFWALGALVNYGPSSFLTWSARQSAAARQSWRVAFDAERVFPTVQYLALFANAYLISALSMVSFLILMRMLGHIDAVNASDGAEELDFDHVFDAFMARSGEGGIAGEFWAGLAFALLGAFHAVMMALMQDHASNAAWRRRKGLAPPSPRRGAAVAAAHAAGLALLCFVANDATGAFAAARRNDALAERVDDVKAAALARLHDATATGATAPGAAPPGSAAPGAAGRPEGAAQPAAGAADLGASLAALKGAIDYTEARIAWIMRGEPFAPEAARFAAFDVALAAAARDRRLLEGAASALAGLDAEADDPAGAPDGAPASAADRREGSSAEVAGARAALAAALAERDEAGDRGPRLPAFDATDSLLFQSVAAGLFGLLSALLTARSLRRLYALRDRHAETGPPERPDATTRADA